VGGDAPEKYDAERRNKNMSKHSQTVADIYAAFGRGDIPAIVEQLAENVTWVHHGAPDVPYGKERHGKEQASQFFGELAAAVDVTLFEVKQLVETDNTVVAIGRWGGKAKPTGKDFTTNWMMQWTFENDRVVYYESLEDSLTIAKAFQA
jgi:ketosteroid isomerase-like protein